MDPDLLSLCSCYYIRSVLNNELPYISVGSANLIYKEPHDKYFKLCSHMVSVTATQVCPCNVKVVIDDIKMNECLGSKKNL